MAVSRGFVRGALAGALAAAVVVVGTVAVGSDDPPVEPSLAPTATSAAARFVDAWRHHRAGTWLVEGRMVRQTPGGRFETPVRRAQRPPLRSTAGFGAAEAIAGDVAVACNPSPDDGSALCRSGATATYDEQVAAELRTLEGLVEGDDAPYAVADVGLGCFALDLRVDAAAPPYGQRATLCFDGATGALVRADVRRQGGRDLFEATAVRGEVSDADLRPDPAGEPPGAGMRAGAGADASPTPDGNVPSRLSLPGRSLHVGARGPGLEHH